MPFFDVAYQVLSILCSCLCIHVASLGHVLRLVGESCWADHLHTHMICDHLGISLALGVYCRLECFV